MKLTTKQNWFLTLMVTTLLLGLPVNAQVKIGDLNPPKDYSILELVSGGNKGLRLPQIETTSQRDAAFTNVYAFNNDPLSIGMQIYNLQTKQVETWDGKRWVGGSAQSGEAIWLPSTTFPWGTVGGLDITVNLFNVYAKAFKSTSTHNSGNYYTSTGATVNVPYHNNDAADDFYYVITDYDNTAIQIVSLNGTNGDFTYRVLKPTADGAWVNILLVRK